MWSRASGASGPNENLKARGTANGPRRWKMRTGLVGVAASLGVLLISMVSSPNFLDTKGGVATLGEVAEPEDHGDLAIGEGRAVMLGAIALEEAPGCPLYLDIGQPLQVLAGDFTGNGRGDLVITAFAFEHEARTFRTGVWLLSAGESDSFGEPVLIHEVMWGDGPALMTVAEDVDDDGVLDFVLLDLTSKGVWILSGDGLGGIKRETFVEVPGLVLAADIAIADLDRDGRKDIVIAGLHAIYVLWGSEDSTWLPDVAVDCAADEEAYKLVVGDFDGDGLEDLALVVIETTVMPVDYRIDVLVNTGGRGFLRGAQISFEEPGLGLFALAAGDLNGDGHLDLITSGGEAVWVLVSLGSGNFTLDKAFFVFDPFIPMIALGGLSADGCPNIVVPASTIHRVVISGECYSEHIPRALSMTGFVFPSPSAVGVWDINGDSLPDLVVAGSDVEGQTVLSVLLSRER